MRRSVTDYSCWMITSLFWHKKRIDSSEKVIQFQYLRIIFLSQFSYHTKGRRDRITLKSLFFVFVVAVRRIWYGFYSCWIITSLFLAQKADWFVWESYSVLIFQNNIVLLQFCYHTRVWRDRIMLKSLFFCLIKGFDLSQKVYYFLFFFCLRLNIFQSLWDCIGYFCMVAGNNYHNIGLKDLSCDYGVWILVRIIRVSEAHTFGMFVIQI